jgi:hypothetical protein
LLIILKRKRNRELRKEEKNFEEGKKNLLFPSTTSSTRTNTATRRTFPVVAVGSTVFFVEFFQTVFTILFSTALNFVLLAEIARAVRQL